MSIVLKVDVQCFSISMEEGMRYYPQVCRFCMIQMFQAQCYMNGIVSFDQDKFILIFSYVFCFYHAAVFALWEAPEMLPSFMLKGGEVSRYVLGGADLMFPGILIPAEGFPSFAAGEIWAVKVPGNLAPIAVSLFIFC